MDSDDDGFTDAVEIAAGSDPVDDESVAITYPDFSDAVDAEIGSLSGLDSIEGNLALWLDATNVDGSNNQTLSDGDAVSTWMDLSSVGTHATTYTGSATFSSNDAIVFDGNDSLEVPANALTQSSYTIAVENEVQHQMKITLWGRLGQVPQIISCILATVTIVNLQLLTIRTILNMPFQLNQTNIILLMGDLKMAHRIDRYFLMVMKPKSLE